MRTRVAVYLTLSVPFFVAADERPQTMRYVRPAGSQYRLETEITLKQSLNGDSISSVTHRGQTQLSLTSGFDANGRLQSAKVKIVSEAGQQTAEVHIEREMVTVKRANGRIDALDCPLGIIVTSAPDWTDAFMLMRRYDEKEGGEQQFDGLWIHPSREPVRLTFTVRHEGTDTVELNGEPQRLERFSVVLRNDSRYVTWRNGQRELVRLVANGQERPAIVLNGWEKATVGLTARSR